MCIGMYKDKQCTDRTRGVIMISGDKGWEEYSEKLLTVHSFFCLLQAAKDGIFKNSNLS